MSALFSHDIERFTPTAFVSVGKHEQVQTEIAIVAEIDEESSSLIPFVGGIYTIDTARLVIPSAIIEQWEAIFKGEEDGVVTAPLTLHVDGVSMEIEIDIVLDRGQVIMTAADLPDYVKSWLQDVINR